MMAELETNRSAPDASDYARLVPPERTNACPAVANDVAKTGEPAAAGAGRVGDCGCRPGGGALAVDNHP